MSMIPGGTGTAASFPDGFTGSQLANVETISATKVLVTSDRKTQLLTPSGALRVAQLPATALLGEQWVFICGPTAAFSLQVNSSNGSQISLLAPGESVSINAGSTTPVANTDWIAQVPTTVLSNGSVSTPALRFTGSGSDTGIYSPSTDAIAFSNAGVQSLLVSSGGAFSIGLSSTSNYSVQSHRINGGLHFGGTGSGDSDRQGFINANTYNSLYGAQARTTGIGGTAILLDSRTTDSGSAFEIRANKAADSATTPATPILSGTQNGSWTFGTLTTSTIHIFRTSFAADTANGFMSFRNASNTTDVQFETGNGSVPGISSPIRVSKYTSNNRSISAAGTVNVNGADYAEYMLKNGNFTILKGDIVGVDVDGRLTNKWSEAISFVVKSTNPSLVGGDNWFSEPKPEDSSSPEYADWVQSMELARAQVDRIAFCGQVPVNLTANVGDYIIPQEGISDSISASGVASPTFEQYRIAIGRVIKIEEDRPIIIVKIA
jgi:hypothetical protein